MAGGENEGGRSAIDRFTTLEMLEELDREIQMRRNTFVRLVHSGKLSQSVADRRIDLMSAIRRRIAATAGQF